MSAENISKATIVLAATEPTVQLRKKKEKNIGGRGSFPGGLVTSRAPRHCRRNLDILYGSGMSIKFPESSPDNRASAGL